MFLNCIQVIKDRNVYSQVKMLRYFINIFILTVKYIDEKAAQITATMSEAVGQVCQQSLNKVI